MSCITTQDLGNQEISEKFQNFEKLHCTTQSNFVKNKKPLERKLSFCHSALLKKLEFVSNVGCRCGNYIEPLAFFPLSFIF